jgi:hypothetical protein
MPIPTDLDRQMADITNRANCIAIALRVMKHGAPGMREQNGRLVRERLQDYCDAVIETANAIIAE